MTGARAGAGADVGGGARAAARAGACATATSSSSSLSSSTHGSSHVPCPWLERCCDIVGQRTVDDEGEDDDEGDRGNRLDNLALYCGLKSRLETSKWRSYQRKQSHVVTIHIIVTGH